MQMSAMVVTSVVAVVAVESALREATGEAPVGLDGIVWSRGRGYGRSPRIALRGLGSFAGGTCRTKQRTWFRHQVMMFFFLQASESVGSASFLI
jgi:hypothetical protein